MSDIIIYKLDKGEKLWKYEVSVIGIWNEIVKVELFFEEKVWKFKRFIIIINFLVYMYIVYNKEENFYKLLVNF